MNAPGINLDIYLAQESRLLTLYLGELLLDLPGKEMTPVPAPLASRSIS